MDLTVSSLTLRRGQQLALDGVSATFAAGTQAVVWGEAGCGKTSLLKVLAGLIKPTSGVVRWGADDLWALAPDERRRRQAALCLVFQTDALFDSMTLLDNVLLPLVQREVPRDEAAFDALDRDAHAPGRTG